MGVARGLLCGAAAGSAGSQNMGRVGERFPHYRDDPDVRLAVRVGLPAP